MFSKILTRLLPFVLLVGATAGCTSESPALLGATPPGNGPVVNFDVFHKPFPEIPLPNDFATRYDKSSPTHRRLNASILAGPTQWEQATREELDKLSGWGTLAPITVSFSEPIDPNVILATNKASDNFNYKDDPVLVLDVTPGSAGFCEAVPLDLGQGNYPQVLREPNPYEADPRGDLATMTIEETEEDTNNNGKLDPGEDTDMDGVLDHPDTLDGTPTGQRLEFYERETNTLVMKPLVPMREGTTYAVVLTKRLVSPAGDPVRSPFSGINHAGQTTALEALPKCLERYGLGSKDVAFTWSFTTQNISHDYKEVRDGLYGMGPLAKVSRDFPATLSRLDDLIEPGPGVTSPKVVPADKFTALAVSLLQLTGGSPATTAVFSATMKNVDYVVAGAINSPQFFPRKDADGNMLPLYRQVWNLGKPPRAEEVPFWLFVPKNRQGPAPVAIFIHGHGGSKFDAMVFAGMLASYGIATMGIDGPSHGVGLDSGQLGIIQGAFKNAGMEGLGHSLLTGRAIDWTGDGNVDSGDDFWSAYVFHTRDIVRQTIVDVMQTVRTLRAFDGKNHWAFDPASTGSDGLAGDFDGDGQVDVGGDAPLHILGGSLGGILGSDIAGLEPQVDSVVAIVPGGMLNEIGTRSTLGGVRDAMVLRAIGPLFYEDQGALMLHANEGQTSDKQLKIADLPTLEPGDTVIIENHNTGEYRCAMVQPSGTFRVGVSSDAGDPLELSVYNGTLPSRAPEGCVIPSPADASPYVDVTTFGYDVTLAGQTWTAGSPLVAPTDGFGQRRATPDLRRFLGLSQIALDPADPMNWAPYWNGTRKMTYGTGETVHTNVLEMPSIGDPGVLIAGGVALGRSAGFIPYDHSDPKYGKSINQVMLDTWTTEGTYNVGHYHDSQGNPVLMDVEDFANGNDGVDVPRLDPPLRLMTKHPDGSWTGFILFMLDPKGAHGFVAPDPSSQFDLGTYLINMSARYLQSSGHEFSWNTCQATSNCPWATFPLQ